MRLALLSVFLALPLLAEEPVEKMETCTPETCTGVVKLKPPPTPQITTEQKLDYQRARANLVVLQSQILTAQRVLDDNITGMQKICGDRGLVTDAKGDPTCGVKEEKK